MDRFGTALPRRIEHGGDIQVTFQRRGGADQVRFVRNLDMQRRPVRLRVDGDDANAHRPQRPRDPDGDLSPIGDQHFTKHCLP